MGSFRALPRVRLARAPPVTISCAHDETGTEDQNGIQGVKEECGDLLSGSEYAKVKRFLFIFPSLRSLLDLWVMEIV